MTGAELGQVLSGRWIVLGFCRRDHYELVVQVEGGALVRFTASASGAQAELIAAAPDASTHAPIGEAGTLAWYRADLGLTTLAVAIAQGLTIEGARIEAAKPDDVQVKLDFAGARTFVLYGDADVDDAGKLSPRLRSRWEELR